MIEVHTMVQRMEKRSGQKPVAIVKRANYINGKLRKSVKVFNGNRWTTVRTINMARKTQKTKKTQKIRN
jgi:hypothetical protein